MTLAGNLATTRTARGLSLRQAASEIGVGFGTVYRVEQGHNCTSEATDAIRRWIGGPDLDAEQDAWSQGFAAGLVAAADAIKALGEV